MRMLKKAADTQEKSPPGRARRHTAGQRPFRSNQITCSRCTSRTAGWQHRRKFCRQTGRKSGTRRSRRSGRSGPGHGYPGSESDSWYRPPLQNAYAAPNGRRRQCRAAMAQLSFIYSTTSCAFCQFLRRPFVKFSVGHRTRTASGSDPLSLYTRTPACSSARTACTSAAVHTSPGTASGTPGG